MGAIVASPKLFLVFGAYVLVCIPAIFVAEHNHWPQWPLHTSQLAATVLCALTAAAFLWSTRKGPFGWSHGIAAVALVLAGLWVAFVVGVVLTIDFSGIS